MSAETPSTRTPRKPHVSLAAVGVAIFVTGILLATMRALGLEAYAMLFPICVGLGSLACFFFVDARSAGAAGGAVGGIVGILAPLPLWRQASKTLQAVNYQADEQRLLPILIGFSVLLGFAIGGIVGRLLGETVHQHRRGVRRALRDAPSVVIVVFLIAATIVYLKCIELRSILGKLDIGPMILALPISVFVGALLTFPAMGPAFLMMELGYFVADRVFKRKTAV